MGDEERQEPAHQEEAYRKAWEPFDPNEEEQDQGDKNREEPPESREREEAGEWIQDEEGMTSKGLKVPRGPTQKEVEEHSMTHWPFRDWCAHCVRGKAKSIGHRRKRSEHEVPIIVIDYMWMTGEGDKEGQPGRLRGMPILGGSGRRHRVDGSLGSAREGGALVRHKGLDHVRRGTWVRKYHPEK